MLRCNTGGQASGWANDNKKSRLNSKKNLETAALERLPKQNRQFLPHCVNRLKQSVSAHKFQDIEVRPIHYLLEPEASGAYFNLPLALSQRKIFFLHKIESPVRERCRIPASDKLKLEKRCQMEPRPICRRATCSNCIRVVRADI